MTALTTNTIAEKKVAKAPVGVKSSVKRQPSIRSRLNRPAKTHVQSARHCERLKLEEAFRLQNQLLAARDYAESVIGAAPPLLILDAQHPAAGVFLEIYQINGHPCWPHRGPTGRQARAATCWGCSGKQAPPHKTTS